jgi:hypothetical protein
MKNQTLSVIHFRSSNQSYGRRPHRLSLYIICAAACVTLLPIMRAVSPPPDGGYPGNNTAEGDNALASLSSGTANTANGAGALASDTSGSSNTAIGFEALLNNVSGNNNTATGVDALVNNTTGHENTANGVAALVNNTTGSFNTATGISALANNTSAQFNTANGFQALQSNTTGAGNTANGYQALQSNTTGAGNTASGWEALFHNTTGGNNTANGIQALFSNTTGNFNAANGLNALESNTTGSSNMAEGFAALAGNTRGNNNVALGYSAGINLTTGNNNIDIGANVTGTAGEANTIRIGKSGTQQKTFIAGIFGKTVANGAGVMINSNGQLGTVQSSARFKNDIKPMDKASEAILKLKPVTFHYKEELDPNKISQFGLIAEDVEKVDPELVVRDENGNVTTVRYESVNAMLLNEFLKAHRIVEEQAAINERQEATIARLEAALKEQAVQIQKVSDEVALSRPAPRVVSNNP